METRFGWVRKRDGRLVPFEADKISRALFAASETVGRPDAFLARELTDSIVHFLDAECAGNTPTTEQIAELIVKVVRELGQPTLARAFADAQTAKSEPRPDAAHVEAGASRAVQIGPSLDQFSQWVEKNPVPADVAWRAARVCGREFSLREVFTRDLVAAQSDGLLTLTGLESPLELAGAVLTELPTSGADLIEAILDARSVVSEFFVLDGVEYSLAQGSAEVDQAAEFVRALKTAMRTTRLQAVINLNSAVPPPQLKDLAVGPLFEGHGGPAEPERLDRFRAALVEELLRPGLPKGALRLDWHLGSRDFAPENRGVLLTLGRRALEGAPLAFVFDRPRRALPLAEGLDRQVSAVLLAVGLHLPRLIELAPPGIDAALFLQKLGSLARLALSAGTQKREFLRRHSQGRSKLTGGFLLERARLVVVPVGLESATRLLIGRGLCSGGEALDYARQMVERLHDVLCQDGRASLLETGLDSFPSQPIWEEGNTWEAECAGGLMPWDSAAAPKSQLRAAGPLHAAAGMGTAVVHLRQDQPITAEEVAELLHYAWQQTEVVRVRFARRAALVAPPCEGGLPGVD
jgi:hypothetical protein